MDGERRDVVLGQPGTEIDELPRRIVPPPPGGGIVCKDLERGRPDGMRPFGGLDHAVAERQVGTQPAAIGKHGGHRSAGIGDLTVIKSSITISWWITTCSSR